VAFARPLLVAAAGERAEKLARLVYELLDAHHDTERLVRGKGTELEWDAHMDYLRTLQRLGREVLAEAVETCSDQP
jgi:carbon monoxide dehydrogenase subunit G